MIRQGRSSKEKMGKISRIGSYAIASSITENQRQPCITCTTFNILAPIYKRLDHEDQSCRESDNRVDWLTRNHRILDWLLCERSSLICLQEFWVGNQELVNLYEKRLGDAGYISFNLGRTNNRGDGLLMSVQKEYFTVIDYKELLFNDCGDRVAQLLHVKLALPISQCSNNDIGQEILFVNTHLLFPHDSSLCLVRLRQVYKILQYVESYQRERQLMPMPIILCGDWNGSKRGHVYKFLRSQGFVSSYDTAHQYTDADAHKYLLLKTALAETRAFAFLKADKEDSITYSSFCEALRQLNLFGHCHGLSDEETTDLWSQADIDGNGVLDYKEFLEQLWKPESDEGNEYRNEEHKDVSDGQREQTVGFSVKNAVLFPPEVEKGRWPEDYSLSDHARLTVVFSPIRMPCSQMTS
ncbi:uncharacterized calcium-binding protein At1g02270 isoform X3 [Prosopis cineraria]|uniref:uncharacterized calcium-binding protein At1g02270 isoform X3 n=1 Tax=Prosopis cineraria TaxID=364024 RepID=UPI00240F0934|nr:uncharacterized calcium-binding protein At1g02270 isoform X3 [Prosopis cineraria]